MEWRKPVIEMLMIEANHNEVSNFSKLTQGRCRSRTLEWMGYRRLALLAWIGIIVTLTTVSCSPAEPGARPEGHSEASEPPKEAASGFDNASNGFEKQDAFDKDREAFEEVETVLPQKPVLDDREEEGLIASHRSFSSTHSAAGTSGAGEGSPGGLGPVYNGTSCVSCHQNPVTGSSSQVSELRAGRNENGKFVEHAGGSLIHQRAIDAAIQEHLLPADTIRALRMSTTVLGSGFVEVIPDTEIREIQKTQLKGLQGTIALVPVAVRGKKVSDDKFIFEFVERAGRFGWKCQEASLINFSAGAYANEMGITSPLNPEENTSDGRDISQFDRIADPEDEVDPIEPDNNEHPFGDDVKAFTRFMRSTKVPPRDFSLAGTELVQKGEKIFRDLDPEIPNANKLGCAVCHRPDYTTPKAGTPIRPFNNQSTAGSDLDKVPEALGNKKIHPFSDFMLHDIGTGDGIVQTQHAQKPPSGMSRVNLRESANSDKHHVAPAPKIATANAVKLDDGQITANMIRTAPLWGLRVRPQLLHDGRALTLDAAIEAHKLSGGDSKTKVDLPANYQNLPPEKKNALKAFLNSL